MSLHSLPNVRAIVKEREREGERDMGQTDRGEGEGVFEIPRFLSWGEGGGSAKRNTEMYSCSQPTGLGKEE